MTRTTLYGSRANIEQNSQALHAHHNDDDDELERIARQKGVGKFETRGTSANWAGEGSSAQEALILSPPTAGPFACIDICKINFEAPGYH